ncbi:MAG: class I SAM-dependent methyltransferase [Gemmatimonadetes bacterium]|nr:class I SAM-dependent methyltransferase [Gemmatimonadota bacterium]
MLYDRIGVRYGEYRRPDGRIAEQIRQALGEAATVLNVGAGTGSYEPVRHGVVAVEPSAEMVRQRPPGSAPVVRAVAADLPFRDASFDAALAVLTIHHWPDWQRGLAEMQRVARTRVVLLTWDPASDGFWLVREYFPQVLEVDRRILPSIGAIESVLGPVEVRTVPVPADCTDGFLGAYWRRPSAYLDAGVRGAISAFARFPEMDQGLARLAADLADGRWMERHGDLLKLQQLDAGYRLVVARGSTSAAD